MICGNGLYYEDSKVKGLDVSYQNVTENSLFAKKNRFRAFYILSGRRLEDDRG
jgi:hypothetical protein